MDQSVELETPVEPKRERKRGYAFGRPPKKLGHPVPRGVSENAAMRRAQSFELRVAGASFSQIGKTVGVSAMQAYRDVERVLAETRADLRESVQDYIDLENGRIDEMLLGIWKSARAGDPESVRAAVRLMERRAKLLGLDAPTRTELTGPGGSPMQVQAEAVIAQLPTEELRLRMERMRALAQAPPELPADSRRIEAAPEVGTVETPEEQAYAQRIADRAARNGGNGNGDGH